MNKIYRVVWSRARGARIVVGERARSAGQSSGVCDRRPQGAGREGRLLRGALTALGAALLLSGAPLSLAAPAPDALPTGGQISAGSGSISRSGNAMTVQQHSGKLIANWDSFNIGADASVTFQQPGADSMALNRVTGQDPSQIFGQLNANGQVMLVNPNGIVFGAGSQVNVGGITASTLQISDADFLAGQYRFTEGADAGAIQQAGHILANGGVVALIGSAVTNDGSIQTPGGSTALAAGGSVTLDFHGDGLMTVTVTQAQIDSLVQNNGLVQVGDGRVVLTAGAARDLQSGAVNNDGILEAQGLVSQNGRIVLDGGAVNNRGRLDGDAVVLQGHDVLQQGEVIAQGGTVSVDATRTTYLDGTVDVSRADGTAGSIEINTGKFEGMAGGTLRADGVQGGSIKLEAQGMAAFSSTLSAQGSARGGRIEVTGDTVMLLNAKVDASGVEAGGTVHLGGGWQGGGELAHARETVIGQGSEVRANGAQGGEVVVWSTDHSEHYGTLSAADGGRIELSSKGKVTLNGELNAGQGGEVLLDPKNIVITDTLPNSVTMARKVTSGSVGGQPSLADNHQFGSSVALDGDRMAVSAAGDGPGAVHLFTGADGDFSGLTWRKKLSSGSGAVSMPTLGAGDWFGSAVALSGDNLVVGAPNDDTHASNAGAIHLFNGVGSDFSGLTWRDKHLPELAASAAVNLYYGIGVALDGDRLVVGAEGFDCCTEPASDNNRGAVFLYTGVTSGANFSGLTYNGLIGSGSAGMPALPDWSSFGGSVALDGDRLVVGARGGDPNGFGSVHLFSGVGTDFSGLTWRGKITSGSGATDMPTLNDYDYFGRTVALDGDYLAVQAEGDDTGASAAGAVYLFTQVGSDFSGLRFDRKLASSTGATGMPALSANDYFGSGLAIDGTRLAVGAKLDDTGGSNAGALYLFNLPPAADAVNTAVYGNNPSADSYILTGDLTTLLNAGTAVTLQANNDITVSSLISANNPGGNGGHLTLQAGRSLLINATIGTDNGNLTLIANDTTANGVQNAHRDTGQAEITMAWGTSLNVGSGNVLIELRDGAGKTYRDSGDINLHNVTANTIRAINTGPSAGSGVAVNGVLTANAGSGDALVLAGDGFSNNTGASALSAAGAGRWLVWTDSPTTDTRNGLTADFKQYNATYGVTTVAGSGDGFLYTLAPSITAGLTGTVSKTYDGNTSATLAAGNYTVSGAVDGDTVTLNNPSSGSYADKNAGSGKNVSVSGVSIASASNGAATVYGYQLASSTASGNVGTINARSLTVGYSGVNRVYDGSTNATVTTSDNRLSGDTFTINRTAGFSDKNVGTGKAVSVSGVSLSGTDAGNYVLASTSGATTADITAKALALSGLTANDKVYDGATTATVSSYGSLSGVEGGDTVNLDSSGASAAFADKNVGTGKTVTVSGLGLSGTDAGNYSLGSAATSADITARTLTVSYTGVDRVYDGTTNATVTTSDDRVSGDTLTINRSAAFSDKNVGTGKTVNVSGASLVGADAGNYVLASSSGATTADITAKVLSLTGLSANSKVYDGNTSATVSSFGSLSGVVSGDTVNLDSSSASASFADKNVGTGKTMSVSGLGLSGADAGNYVMSSTAAASADITARTLLVSYTGVDRIYDGTTHATVTTSDNRVSGDTLAIGRTAAFNDKHVGTGKTVNVTGVSLSGIDAANYIVAATGSATANITPRAITLSGLSVENKTYDGNTDATVARYGALSGVLSGDAVQLSTTRSSARFADPNPGINKLVTISGLALAGADGGNYAMSAPTARADINSTQQPPRAPEAGPTGGGGGPGGTPSAGPGGGGANPFAPGPVVGLPDGGGTAGAPGSLVQSGDRGGDGRLFLQPGSVADANDDIDSHVAGVLKTVLPLYRQRGDTLTAVGEFLVTRQSGRLEASESGAELNGLPPTINETDLRTTEGEITMADGTRSPLQLAATMDDILLVGESGLGETFDPQSLLLLALPYSQQLGLELAGIKAVVFR